MNRPQKATMRMYFRDGQPPCTDSVRFDDAREVMGSDSELADEARILHEYDRQNVAEEDRPPLAWKWPDSIEQGRFMFAEADADFLEREGAQLTWLEILRI